MSSSSSNQLSLPPLQPGQQHVVNPDHTIGAVQAPASAIGRVVTAFFDGYRPDNVTSEVISRIETAMASMTFEALAQARADVAALSQNALSDDGMLTANYIIRLIGHARGDEVVGSSRLQDTQNAILTRIIAKLGWVRDQTEEVLLQAEFLADIAETLKPNGGYIAGQREAFIRMLDTGIQDVVQAAIAHCVNGDDAAETMQTVSAAILIAGKMILVDEDDADSRAILDAVSDSFEQNPPKQVRALVMKVLAEVAINGSEPNAAATLVALLTDDRWAEYRADGALDNDAWTLIADALSDEEYEEVAETALSDTATLKAICDSVDADHAIFGTLAEVRIETLVALHDELAAEEGADYSSAREQAVETAIMTRFSWRDVDSDAAREKLCWMLEISDELTSNDWDRVEMLVALNDRQFSSIVDSALKLRDPNEPADTGFKTVANAILFVGVNTTTSEQDDDSSGPDEPRAELVKAVGNRFSHLSKEECQLTIKMLVDLGMKQESGGAVGLLGTLLTDSGWGEFQTYQLLSNDVWVGIARLLAADEDATRAVQVMMNSTARTAILNAVPPRHMVFSKVANWIFNTSLTGYYAEDASSASSAVTLSDYAASGSLSDDDDDSISRVSELVNGSGRSSFSGSYQYEYESEEDGDDSIPRAIRLRASAARSSASDGGYKYDYESDGGSFEYEYDPKQDHSGSESASGSRSSSGDETSSSGSASSLAIETVPFHAAAPFRFQAEMYDLIKVPVVRDLLVGIINEKMASDPRSVLYFYQAVIHGVASMIGETEHGVPNMAIGSLISNSNDQLTAALRGWDPSQDVIFPELRESLVAVLDFAKDMDRDDIVNAFAVMPFAASLDGWYAENGYAQDRAVQLLLEITTGQRESITDDELSVYPGLRATVVSYGAELFAQSIARFDAAIAANGALPAAGKDEVETMKLLVRAGFAGEGAEDAIRKKVRVICLRQLAATTEEQINDVIYDRRERLELPIRSELITENDESREVNEAVNRHFTDLCGDFKAIKNKGIHRAGVLVDRLRRLLNADLLTDSQEAIFNRIAEDRVVAVAEIYARILLEMIRARMVTQIVGSTVVDGERLDDIAEIRPAIKGMIPDFMRTLEADLQAEHGEPIKAMQVIQRADLLDQAQSERVDRLVEDQKERMANLAARELVRTAEAGEVESFLRKDLLAIPRLLEKMEHHAYGVVQAVNANFTPLYRDFKLKVEADEQPANGSDFGARFNEIAIYCASGLLDSKGKDVYADMLEQQLSVLDYERRRLTLPNDREINSALASTQAKYRRELSTLRPDSKVLGGGSSSASGCAVQ